MKNPNQKCILPQISHLSANDWTVDRIELQFTTLKETPAFLIVPYEIMVKRRRYYFEAAQ